ncbi:MAG: glycosyltransferase [Nitrospirae bacterium]|nr:MAG: glycosyltransferase [Nitrospirota bacterium]
MVNPNAMPSHRYILGMRVDATSYEDATRQILSWAKGRESRYVCAANVHMTMESFDSAEFRRVVNGADLVTPDGVPLVWTLRLLGVQGQTRVYGPDLTVHVVQAAANAGVPVGFFGGTPEALRGIVQNLETRFPAMQVAYAFSPPFRPLTPEEDDEIVAQINTSGARILFVGLGCPKQERWMAEHLGRIQAVMLGVGAAFDFHAGTIRQAPSWMQRSGLEWLFRLIVEPKRLWRRYLVNNPRFVVNVLLQLSGLKQYSAMQ